MVMCPRSMGPVASVRPSTDTATLAGPSASTGPGAAGRMPLAVGARHTPLAHAAISARRETPSLARMCSTWEFAVFGDIPSSSASSAFVRPVDDLPGDLELAGRQRMPGFRLLAATPRHPGELRGAREQRLAAELRRGGLDLADERHRRPRSDSSAGGTPARSSLAQRASQRRPRASQAATAASSATRAPEIEPSARWTRPVACRIAGSGDVRAGTDRALELVEVSRSAHPGGPRPGGLAPRSRRTAR